MDIITAADFELFKLEQEIFSNTTTGGKKIKVVAKAFIVTGNLAFEVTMDGKFVASVPDFAMMRQAVNHLMENE